MGARWTVAWIVPVLLCVLLTGSAPHGMAGAGPAGAGARTGAAGPDRAAGPTPAALGVSLADVTIRPDPAGSAPGGPVPDGPGPEESRPGPAAPGAGTVDRPGGGIVHRELTVGPGGTRISADVVDADLTAPGVRAGLLTAGAVSARASVPALADGAGARAAINGDFFDLGGSNAPAGPQVRDGRPLSSAVPTGRRPAPAVPGSAPGDVLAVGPDGRARLDRLTLAASVTTPAATIPVQSLNQYAVPVDGVGIVTPDWGAADRARTLCGSDTDFRAPCAPDGVEVAVSGGTVTAVRAPGSGPLAPGETVLLGRDRGATALRALRPGDPVDVGYRLLPARGTMPVTAVGGSPILVGGARPGPLDARLRSPRSAAGISADGRRLLLVTVDGRETSGDGITLAGLADLLVSLGATDAVNLDGGGSSTLVHRDPGAGRVTIVNDPSVDATRLVPNALGVFGPG